MRQVPLVSASAGNRSACGPATTRIGPEGRAPSQRAGRALDAGPIREQIAGPKRSALEAAEAAAQVGRGGSKHGLDVEPAGHRHVAPRVVAALDPDQ